MSAKFSNQRDDQSQPPRDASEVSTASTAEVENVDAGSLKAATAHSTGAFYRWSGTFVSALASRDYIGVLVATVVLTLGIGILHPDFLHPAQLLDILNQATFVAILACGMAFLLAMRELDLSAGSTYGLTSLCAAMLMHAGVNSWLSVGIGLLIGAGLGLTNGLLIQLFRLPSIIATLATLSIYRGFIYALSSGNQVIGLALTDPFAKFVGGQLCGIATNIWIMFAVVALFTVVLYSTPFGYRVRAIGSNPEAAEFSGLPMKRVRLWAFVLMGLLGGLAGMLSLGYFGSSDPNLGTGYELLAIAAAVIGGTPLRGGKATIIGAALGAVLLGVVNSGLAYFNVPINWTEFATGTVILLAVSLDSLLRRTRTNRRLRI
jgi:ribose transport system permease protein